MLTDEERQIALAARKLSTELLAPNAGRWDKEECFPREAMLQLSELGFLSMLVPEAMGGLGAGPVAYASAVRELARGCPATTVTMMVTNMVADAIARFGSDTQKQRYLPEFSGRRYTCAAFSLSEPSVGSDPAAMKTRAKKDGGGFVLSGEKAWVTSAGEAPLYLVMAVQDDLQKPTAFLVPADARGLSVSKREEKMGMRASPTAGIVLDEVRVTAEAVLGGEGKGMKVALTALDGGRIGVGAQALGIGTAALEAALKYAKERHAFGRPIAEFQAMQWKLANTATELDAAELLILRAARMRQAGKPCSKEAAMAKLFASDAAYRACNEAVQIHGGYGYIGEFPVERHFRDVRVTQIYEGTNEIQRVVIARSVLGD